MRKILLTLILIFALHGFSQELNLGGSVGMGDLSGNPGIYTLGATIEYRPHHARFSVNTEPYILTDFEEILFTAPLYLKFIFGNRFRVCPTFGGFWRSNRNLGWSAGLSLEYALNEPLFVFIRGDYNKDYYKKENPSHFGQSFTVTKSTMTIWASVGLKINLLKKDQK
jgi:hypothetical protein